MAKVELKNNKGEKIKDITISDSIWKIEVNDNCLKQMIRLQLDANRQGTAKTKQEAKFLEEEENLGNKKELVVQELVQIVHQYGVAEV